MFFCLRLVFAILSAGAEILVSKSIQSELGSIFLVLSLMSPGMFHASIGTKYNIITNYGRDPAFHGIDDYFIHHIIFMAQRYGE